MIPSTCASLAFFLDNNVACNWSSFVRTSLRNSRALRRSLSTSVSLLPGAFVDDDDDDEEDRGIVAAASWRTVRGGTTNASTTTEEDAAMAAAAATSATMDR